MYISTRQCLWKSGKHSGELMSVLLETWAVDVFDGDPGGSIDGIPAVTSHHFETCNNLTN